MKRVGSVELVTGSYRLPVALHATATRYAERHDMSLARLLADALRAYLGQRQKSRKNRMSGG